VSGKLRLRKTDARLTRFGFAKNPQITKLRGDGLKNRPHGEYLTEQRRTARRMKIKSQQNLKRLPTQSRFWPAGASDTTSA